MINDQTNRINILEQPVMEFAGALKMINCAS